MWTILPIGKQDNWHQLHSPVAGQGIAASEEPGSRAEVVILSQFDSGQVIGEANPYHTATSQGSFEYEYSIADLRQGRATYDQRYQGPWLPTEEEALVRPLEVGMV